MRFLLIFLTILIGANNSYSDEFEEFVRGWELSQKSDYRGAMRLWHPLAEKGFLDAQIHLGIMYRDGIGVAKNSVKAAKWFRQAAQQGHPIVQNALGEMYSRGEGVPVNYIEAVKWFRLSAKNRYFRGWYNLGKAYFLGVGVPSDKRKAHIWLSFAAALGDEASMKALAELETKMAYPEIQKARQAARTCQDTNYSECG
jgi:TPR repeat protein